MGDLGFRSLHEALLDAPPERAVEEVLVPWIPRGREILDGLRHHARATPGAWARDTRAKLHGRIEEDLQELYALSRVIDVLLLPFQSGPEDTWAGPALTLEQLTAFLTALGLQRQERSAFHPFQHEIVEVVASGDPGEPISVIETLWPGFRMGQLLIARAGVRVRGGGRHLDPRVAGRSTLHFTHRRRGRPTHDLGAGWGHNSQWRTRFRRDYEDAGVCYYNVDGTLDAAAGELSFQDREELREGAEPELTAEERVELLVHRSFIKTRKDDLDSFPYEDTFAEPATRRSA
ncbi:hypothetical protein [Chondromyces apiculatus]|uniref:Uncharacterized protein n=1 Tax=Chondromyces apiculatus DSM 436 TaxID=1192034 RepID=A0A017SUR5_9BACT|nr:hypothetical protein [Chondromyces apiculatus]EYF00502.1 Hypothetical protein CAP_0536 [Chondromyces apiculatus DSM 436]